MITIACIDVNLFRAIAEDISSDRVIITEERIAHIQERHPGDWEQYSAYIRDTISDPDFILRDHHPATAICVIQMNIGDTVRYLRATLRLHTINDIQGRENSILTFQKINKKEYGRLSRSEKVVYRKA